MSTNAVGKAEKSRRKRAVLPFVPESPPKIMEGHIQDIAAGRRGGWRQTQSDHLRTYADCGQINEDQLEAARWYETAYRASQASGETKFEFSPHGSDILPITECREKALRHKLSVESRLSSENLKIVRGVCGEGYHASAVVREVTGERGKHYPIPRFREALNALRHAIVESRRSGWKFFLQTVNS